MKITTLMTAFNEADIIHHQLEYCSRYSDRIIVFDNESTDDTVKIAKSFGAEIHEFTTLGAVDDWAMLGIFNSSGKFLKQNDEWMFCHSVDEFVVPKFGNFRDVLTMLNAQSISVIKADFYDMVNLGGDFIGNIVDSVKTGSIGDEPWNNKVCGYRYGIAPSWQIGAHKFNLAGNMIVSSSEFIVCHYKYGWGLDRVINRHDKLVLSRKNIDHDWAWHFKNHAWTRDYYSRLVKRAEKVF